MSDQMRHQIAGGTWDAYSFLNEASQLTVVSFNVESALENQHTGLNTSAWVIVYLPVNYVAENGLPAEVAFDRLRRIESHLIRTLDENQVECRLVGRKTYAGQQEFVFQAAALKPFADAIQPMLEKDSAYRMELQSQEGWEYFENNIKTLA